MLQRQRQREIAWRCRNEGRFRDGRFHRHILHLNLQLLRGCSHENLCWFRRPDDMARNIYVLDFEHRACGAIAWNEKQKVSFLSQEFVPTPQGHERY